MTIESLDPTTLTIAVRLAPAGELADLRWLSSLVITAVDCRAKGIRCMMPGSVRKAVRTAVVELAARNPIVAVETATAGARDDEARTASIGGNDHVTCTRFRGARRYVLAVEGAEAGAESASRCAGMIGAALGMRSDQAFEARFAVYELLMNIAEHGIPPSDQDRIFVDITRVDGWIDIAVVDRRDPFDPRGSIEFNLERYVAERRRRGLGLIMTRRLADTFMYVRGAGCNKAIIRKSLAPRDVDPRGGKETGMAELEIGVPTQLEGDRILVALRGDLDAQGALMMEELLDSLLKQHARYVAFDFENVEFISSAGVGVLLGIVSSLRDVGGDAILLKVSPKVLSVLKLLNLEDYFTVRDSVESLA